MGISPLSMRGLSLLVAALIVLVCDAAANLSPSHEFAPLRLRGGGLSTQRTYAMIKPDAVKAGKGDAMQKEIINGGFKIIQQKKMTLSKAQAEKFYAEHKGKPFFEGLEDCAQIAPRQVRHRRLQECLPWQ